MSSQHAEGRDEAMPDSNTNADTGTSIRAAGVEEYDDRQRINIVNSITVVPVTRAY